MPDKFYRNYHQSFHNDINKYNKKEEIDEYQYNQSTNREIKRKKNTLFSSSTETFKKMSLSNHSIKSNSKNKLLRKDSL